MSKQFQLAVDAIKKGDKAFGRQLLLGILKNDRNNIEALLWLTHTGLGMDESAKVFGRVLLIDPENKSALEGLERIRVLRERGYLVTPTTTNDSPARPVKKSLFKSADKPLSGQSTTAPPATATIGSHVLEIMALSDDLSDDQYYRVSGQIKNISDQRLSSVIAVVQFYDQQGQLLQKAESPIEAERLLPNQTVSFQVTIKDNPALNGYAVTFKRLFGSEIPTIDNRQ